MRDLPYLPILANNKASNGLGDYLTAVLQVSRNKVYQVVLSQSLGQQIISLFVCSRFAAFACNANCPNSQSLPVEIPKAEKNIHIKKIELSNA